jgi:hypothetical protein
MMEFYDFEFVKRKVKKKDARMAESQFQCKYSEFSFHHPSKTNPKASGGI